jgi:hypothetical protein
MERFPLHSGHIAGVGSAVELSHGFIRWLLYPHDECKLYSLSKMTHLDMFAASDLCAVVLCCLVDVQVPHLRSVEEAPEQVCVRVCVCCVRAHYLRRTHARTQRTLHAGAAGRYGGEFARPDPTSTCAEAKRLGPAQ